MNQQAINGLIDDKQMLEHQNLALKTENDDLRRQLTVLEQALESLSTQFSKLQNEFIMSSRNGTLKEYKDDA